MKYYYVTQDGHVITERLSMRQVIERFGSVRELEAAGLRLVESKDYLASKRGVEA